jgi:hypothetical protein
MWDFTLYYYIYNDNEQQTPERRKSKGHILEITDRGFVNTADIDGNGGKNHDS